MNSAHISILVGATVHYTSVLYILHVTCKHVLCVCCSDLRPANVLLTDRGHVRLTYISQWSAVTPRLCEEARDNLYMAPGMC